MVIFHSYVNLPEGIPFDQIRQWWSHVEPPAATATQMQPPAPAHPVATLEGTLARWVTIQGLRRRPKQTDPSQVCPLRQICTTKRKARGDGL